MGLHMELHMGFHMGSILGSMWADRRGRNWARKPNRNYHIYIYTYMYSEICMLSFYEMVCAGQYPDCLRQKHIEQHRAVHLRRSAASDQYRLLLQQQGAHENVVLEATRICQERCKNRVLAVCGTYSGLYMQQCLVSASFQSCQILDRAGHPVSTVSRPACRVVLGMPCQKAVFAVSRKPCRTCRPCRQSIRTAIGQSENDTN